MDIQQQIEFFQRIQQIPENRVCFQCNQSPATWASINNGIFLCIKCSGNHRAYGLQVSQILSIDLDKWTENQLNLMQLGGNQNFMKFLEYYDLNLKNEKNNGINSILTQAAQYYRLRLKSLVEGTDMPKDIPSYEEGRQYIKDQGISQQNNNTNIYNYDYGNDIKQPENKQNSFDKMKEGFQQFFDQAANKSKDALQSVNNKISNTNFKQELISFGLKAQQFTNEKYNYVKEKISSNNDENKVQQNDLNLAQNIQTKDQKDQQLQSDEYEAMNQKNEKDLKTRIKEQFEIMDQKYQSSGFKQKLDTLKTDISKKSSDLTESIKNTNYKETFNNMGNKLTQGGKEIGQKTEEFAKKSYTSLMSFFNKK